MPRAMFQRRHYTAVAGILRAGVISGIPELSDAARLFAIQFGGLFARDNPRFNRDRFHAAVKGERYRAQRRPR